MSRILLADDDAGFRDSLQALLVESGHSVRAVGNGLEALSAALKELPDVIVSDIHMPVLDGPDAVVMLRTIARFSNVPVVLMSGEAASESVPVERFFHKPFDPQVLVDMLGRLAVRSHAASRFARVASVSAPNSNDDSTVTTCLPEQLHERIVHALALLAEQEMRVVRLERHGFDTTLAVDVCEALAGSVAALSRYQQEVTSRGARTPGTGVAE
ncbi:response regulator [Paraburkholderia sp. SIMBA_009]|uniref:Response regulator receiver domain-containing protein n=2 Tax=Paraburkholderia tropica TaxID=92647 RepID=A0AAQ1GNF9_9BURK|nr:response regulator [Paraburkholderia tropica]RQN34346.1 response regulator [Paraburkholderia tropica]SEK14241.1 Response regulator receiver domain-containing protein [Paraburkholderia tropica]